MERAPLTRRFAVAEASASASWLERPQKRLVPLPTGEVARLPHDLSPRRTTAVVRISLSYRSIGLTQTLLLLAGVLLGKASLDWLYGLIGGLPQTVPQFWRSRFGRDQGPAAAPNV